MSRKSYLLVLLTVIMVFNYVDRLALGLLLQDIKIDLSLTDTQLGFLTGIAFAFFYALMGIPIARWADRGNRVTIISLTAAVWSVAVALCGMAASFVQLLLIRVGVAVGEAGCHPPALSLIADYYERSERPNAVARYMLGFPLALLIGYFAAGWLNELYGWRATFIALGLPGLLLAALAGFTLKEPRGTSATLSNSLPEVQQSLPEVQPSLREVFVTLWANTTYRNLLLSFSVWYFFAQGILQWQPAFFVRSHSLETGALGTWLALIYGIGSLLGTYLGGVLALRYAVDDERLQLKCAAVLFAGFAVLTTGVYLAPNHYLAFGVLAVAIFGSAAANGPLFALTQTLVPPRMRAMSIALILFFCHLIGMGLGPLAAGALSDALRPWFGDDSLRYALLAFCPGYFWCAWHFWQASRTARRDVAAVQVDIRPAAAREQFDMANQIPEELRT